MDGGGIWIAFAIFGVPLCVAVVYMLFLRGETLGEVECSFDGFFGARVDLKLVVKRAAPSGSKGSPRVGLMYRVPMGAGGRWLSAVEARGLADAITRAAAPDVETFRKIRIAGFGVSREAPVGLWMNVGDNDVCCDLSTAEARELAGLLREGAAR